jgi:ribonuclease D
MNNRQIEYKLITTSDGLESFYTEHINVEWIAFDTEFISEQRYYPQLCLIQVASEKGLFLIDSILIENISPFLRLIEDEKILKITHAGSNDYRLFHSLYGTLPRNIYDVQIAAGFIGYRYPLALDSLLREELGVNINKSQKISDWAERPFSDGQIQYALVDVIHLKRLFDSINQKLETLKRRRYADEEVSLMEREDFYTSTFLKNLASNVTFLALPKTNKIFYIRLYNWRENLAEHKNISRNMILDNKILIYITQNISYGMEQLHQHRRIPSHILKKHGQMFLDFYNAPITKEEENLLKSIPKSKKIKHNLDLLFNQLDLYINYIAEKQSISPALLLSRTELNKIKAEPNFPVEELIAGWRKEILGKEVLQWLQDKKPIEMFFQDGVLVIKN